VRLFIFVNYYYDYLHTRSGDILGNNIKNDAPYICDTREYAISRIIRDPIKSGWIKFNKYKCAPAFAERNYKLLSDKTKLFLIIL